MKGQKFLLCNCYRPPNAGVEYWDVLQCQLDKVKRGDIRNIILVGDLNADPSTPPGRFLKSFVYQNHMHIHVDKPTRITPNSSTCLDQIISNIPFLLQHISIMQPICGSDHNTVTAEFGFRTEKKLCYERRVWHYNKANFDHFSSELLEHDWDPCFFNWDPDSACTKWTENFLNLTKRCIPNKIVTIRPNDVPWYNSQLRKLKRIRYRSHSIAKMHNTSRSWEIFRQHRNQYLNSLHAAEEDYHNNMALELKKDNQTSPKTWWHTVKYFLGENSDQELPLIDDGDKINFSCEEKAEAFNNFFLSNATLKDNDIQLPAMSAPSNGASLSQISASEKDCWIFLKLWM